MSEQMTSAEMLERIRLVGQLSMAAIEEAAARKVGRLTRRPVDPAELLARDVVSALRRMSHELEATIEQIETAQREWAKRGRIVVIPDGPAEAGGNESV